MKLKLFHNCKEATLLISKREETELSFAENFFLRIHILYCKFCRSFSKQSRLLKQSLLSLNQKNEKGEYTLNLSDEKRALLKKEIERHLKNP